MHPVAHVVNQVFSVPGGGFHHCSSDKGGGFCAYADITLAIKVREMPHHLPITCLDWVLIIQYHNNYVAITSMSDSVAGFDNRSYHRSEHKDHSLSSIHTFLLFCKSSNIQYRRQCLTKYKLGLKKEKAISITFCMLYLGEEKTQTPLKLVRSFFLHKSLSSCDVDSMTTWKVEVKMAAWLGCFLAMNTIKNIYMSPVNE